MANDFPRGIRIGVSPAVWEDPSGFELAGISLPERVRTGRPFRLQWHVRSLRPVTGRLEIQIGMEISREVPVFSSGGSLQGEETFTLMKPGIFPIRLIGKAGLARNRPAEILG